MNTKHFIRGALLAVSVAASSALAFTGAAQAQAVTPPIVGVVNMDLVVRESLAGKSVLLEREKYDTVYRGQAEELSNKLRAEDQDLANQRNVLAPDVFQQKYSDFQTRFAQAQGQVREKEQRLEYATNQAMQEVVETLRVVAQGVAGEKGINMVIPTGALLSWDPSMDLTTAVMAKLNARLPSVKFQDPETIQVPGAAGDQAAGGAKKPGTPAATAKPKKPQ